MTIGMSINTTVPHDLIEGDLTREILGAAIDVHRVLGPGLLEMAYERFLAYELETRGIAVERQVALPARYRDLQIDVGFRMDLLVGRPRRGGGQGRRDGSASP